MVFLMSESWLELKDTVKVCSSPFSPTHGSMCRNSASFGRTLGKILIHFKNNYTFIKLRGLICIITLWGPGLFPLLPLSTRRPCMCVTFVSLVNTSLWLKRKICLQVIAILLLIKYYEVSRMLVVAALGSISTPLPHSKKFNFLINRTFTDSCCLLFIQF